MDTPRRRSLWFGAALVLGVPLLVGMAFYGCRESGRIVDDINLPFVDDPAAVGKWRSVDFVDTPADFSPGAKRWEGDPYLEGMVLLSGGKTPQAWWTWTRGVIMHSGDRTASRFELKEIGGKQYMFFEWKSGDYTIRHQKPKYYVLKKED